MESVMFKLWGSSSFAIGKTLEALIKRLIFHYSSTL
jgi:hypothetical protein